MFISFKQEYSAGEAAKILRISRTFLTRLLNKGAMPYRETGCHRKILAKDLFVFKEAKEKEKEEAFSRIAILTEILEKL